MALHVRHGVKFIRPQSTICNVYFDGPRAFIIVFFFFYNSSRISSGFTPLLIDWRRTVASRPSRLSRSLSIDPNAEIDKGLQRARAVLEKSKAKLAAKESISYASDSYVPFFATQQSERSVRSRECVVKHKDEKTGLVTADGERLAQLSEEEQWEIRSLLDVFDDVSEKNREKPSKQLESRDMVTDIINLRKELQRSDYEAIFDKRNIFIGEDN